MAKEAVIGRIAVKVTAEVEEGLRQKLKRKLEKETEGIDPEVEVHVDTKKAEAEAKKANKTIENALDDHTSTVDVDTSKAERKIEELGKKAERTGMKVPVEVDDDDAQADLRTTISRLKKIATDSIGVKVEMKVDDASKAEVQRKIDSAIRDKVAQISTQVKPDDLRKVTRQIEDLTQGFGEKGFRLKSQLDPFTKARTLRDVARLEKDIERSVGDINAEVQVEADMARAMKEVAKLTDDQIASIKVKIPEADATKVRNKVEGIVRQIEKTKINLKADLDSGTRADMDGKLKVLNQQLKDMVGDIEKTVSDIEAKVKFEADTKEAMAKIAGLASDRVASLRVDVPDRDRDRITGKIDGIIRQIEKTKIQLKTDLDATSRSDAEAKLRVFTQQLEDTAEAVEVEVNAGLNKERLFRDTERARKGVEVRMRDIFANIRPDIDRAELAETQLKIRASLEKVADLKVKVLHENDPGSIAKMKAQSLLLERELEKTIEKSVAPQVDQSAFARAWMQLKLLSRTEHKEISVSVRDNTAAAFKKIAGNAAAISYNLTGSRLMWDMHKSKFEAFKNFDQVALKAGAISTALATVSAYTTGIAGNLLSWGNELGKTVGIMPVLIAGFAQVRAQAWIISNAFANFGDKFPAMAAGFGELQASMNIEFWEQAQEPFVNMYNKVFPEFSKGMNMLSSATGAAFGVMSTAITNEFSGKLLPIFQNMSNATNVLSQGFGDLASILETVMTVGSKYLPDMAQGFNNLADSFNNWLTAAASSGEMDQWINTAMTNLSALGSALWDSVAILGTLGQYAANAGASTLESLASTLAGAKAIIQSAGFEEGFTAILASVYNFTDQLGAGIGSQMAGIGQMLVTTATQSLAALGPALNAALSALLSGLANPEFAAGVNEMFAGIAAGVNSLVPALELIGPKIGIVFGFIGGMFEALMPVISGFIVEMASVLTQIEGPVDGLLDKLGPALASVVTALGPAFEAVGSALATVATHLQPVVDTLGSMGPVIAPVAEQFGAFARTLAEKLGPLLPQIAEGFKSFMEIALPTIGSLMDAISSLMTALEPVITFLKSTLPLVGTILGVVSSVVMSSIAGLISGVANLVSGVINIFAGLINFFKSVFTGDWQGVWASVLQIATGIWQVIKGAFLVWMNFGILGILKGGILKLVGLWKGGWSSLGTIAKGAWELIKSGVRAFLNGVYAILRVGVAVIKVVWTGIFNTIKTVAVAGWRIVTGNFRQAMTTITGAIRSGATRVISGIKSMMTGMKTSVSNGIKVVKGFFRRFPGEVRAILGGLGGILVNAGKALIQGLIDGINSMIGGVKDTLQSLTNSITSWKGPLPRDKKLLTPAGQAIIGGLIKGIQSAVPGVKSELQELTDLFADTDFEFGSVNTVNMERAARALNHASSSSLVGSDSEQSAGMVNNFEMHMGNQYTPEMISGEIIYGLRREQRRGVYAKEA